MVVSISKIMVSSSIAAFIDWISSASYTRCGKFQCSCGAIEGEFRISPSSQFIDQNHARCHCDDCVEWMKALPGQPQVSEKFIYNNSTHMVNFYKSDICITKGQSKIRAIQQTAYSIMVRTFCMDCGSPMGSEFPNMPMTLLHPESIVSGPIHVPYLVIGQKWAPSSSTRPWGPGINVREELWGSICFLLRIAGRVILGYLFGKHKTGGLLKLQYDDIPMGRENINKLMTNNTSATTTAAPPAAEKKQE